jgi:hypothetical protein
MWLTAVCVTFNSSAARLKLPSRPAASKARSPLSEGKCRVIWGDPQFNLG